MWLLLLALPVQGWAMVTMQHCGTSHLAMVHTQGRVPHHPPADHQMLHDHCHHAAATNTAIDFPAGGTVQNELSAFQCSACASCCLGAALLVSPMVFLGAPPVATLMTTLSVPAVSFFTSGPDRPPRLPLV
jgi:hypothetical protein